MFHLPVSRTAQELNQSQLHLCKTQRVERCYLNADVSFELPPRKYTRSESNRLGARTHLAKNASPDDISTGSANQC